MKSPKIKKPKSKIKYPNGGDLNPKEKELASKYSMQMEPWDKSPEGVKGKGFDYWNDYLENTEGIKDYNSRMKIMDAMAVRFERPKSPVAADVIPESEVNRYMTPEQADKSYRFDNRKANLTYDLKPKKPFGYGQSEGYKNAGKINKSKYSNAGNLLDTTQFMGGESGDMMGKGMSQIPGLGLLSSAPAFMQEAINTRKVFGDSDSTKTQKADAALGSIGKGTEMVGDAIPIPGISQIVKGVGKGIDMVGNIVGMFPGQDGKKQAREAQNEQTRLNKFQSGTLFSKEGGTLPSSEYKILPSNKSSRKAPIQKLTKDMEIVSQSGQFSHNSNDDIPVDTNNDNQEDLRMEGGEIILKQKDGGQYMLNKKISKVLKPKALALSKGDKISQNTLEKYLKPNAIKLNDENLIAKGLTDRVSALGGIMSTGKKYANGDGGTTKPTVTLSPNTYNKLAKDKPVMTPQEFQKYLVDTGRTNIKTYTQGIPDKGAQVKKHGGKFKSSKYYDAGKFQGEYEPGDLQEAMTQRTLSFSPDSLTDPMTERDFRRVQNNLKQNNSDKQDVSNLSTFTPVTPVQSLNYNVAVPGRESLMSGSTSNKTGSIKNTSRAGLTTGESIAGVGAMLGTGLKALALKRNKSLPIDSSHITNALRRKQDKAEDLLIGAENESIQRVQGSVNKALDSTSYPSVQARLANMRNTIKGGASAESQVRSDYATRLAGLKSQNASTLAGMESQNYFATNDRRQQEIDKRTQGWMDISQDLVNNSFNVGNLANARKYRQDIYDSPVKWNGTSYEVSKVKHGGKIKKPKRIK